MKTRTRSRVVLATLVGLMCAAGAVTPAHAAVGTDRGTVQIRSEVNGYRQYVQETNESAGIDSFAVAASENDIAQSSWRIVELAPGIHQLVNAATGHALAAPPAPNGTSPVASPSNPDDARQQWMIGTFYDQSQQPPQPRISFTNVERGLSLTVESTGYRGSNRVTTVGLSPSVDAEGRFLDTLPWPWRPTQTEEPAPDRATRSACPARLASQANGILQWLQETGENYDGNRSAFTVVASQNDIAQSCWQLSEVRSGVYRFVNVATGNALQDTLEENDDTFGTESAHYVVATPVRQGFAYQEWTVRAYYANPATSAEPRISIRNVATGRLIYVGTEQYRGFGGVTTIGSAVTADRAAGFLNPGVAAWNNPAPGTGQLDTARVSSYGTGIYRGTIELLVNAAPARGLQETREEFPQTTWGSGPNKYPSAREVVASPNSIPYRRWQLFELASGVFRLVNEATGRSLESEPGNVTASRGSEIVRDTSMNPVAAVVGTTSVYQQWRFQYSTDAQGQSTVTLHNVGAGLRPLVVTDYPYDGNSSVFKLGISQTAHRTYFLNPGGYLATRP